MAAIDPHVDRDLGLAAEAAERALLEDAEELGLGAGLHLGDLVEEEGAAVGELEAALAAVAARR